MKASEFITEDDITASGDIAVVSIPLGTVQRRAPLDTYSAKYTKKMKRTSNERRPKRNSRIR